MAIKVESSYTLKGQGPYVETLTAQSDVFKFIVTGLSTIGLEPWAKKRAALDPNIIGNNAIPQLGNVHPSNPFISVIRRKATMIDGDKAEVLVEMGIPDAEQIEPGAVPILTVGTTTVDIETNFDIHGNLLFTNHLGEKEVFTAARSEGLTSFTYQKVSSISPGQLSRDWVPSINSTLIFGTDPIGSWQLVDISGATILGTNTWTASFTFVQRVPQTIKIIGVDDIEVEGWQSFHVETDPKTGKPYDPDFWKHPPSPYMPLQASDDEFTWRLVDHYPKKDFVLLDLFF